ncbi:MAG: histidine kinase [Iphinoe sp. HA4291-MV1]|nr:histidine kinase [Iphinoe sp. HA4291-MV1]
MGSEGALGIGNWEQKSWELGTVNRALPLAPCPLPLAPCPLPND